MDELEISGKQYISSKRAAKENRYHVDYIGQLIRGGKLVGTKVGRTWYVEVDSLQHFLGDAGVQLKKDSTLLNKNKEHLIVHKEGSDTVDVDVHVHKVQEPSNRDDTKTQKPYSYIENPVPLKKYIEVEIKKGLTYLSDEERLIPQLDKSKKINQALYSNTNVEENSRSSYARVPNPKHIPTNLVTKSKITPGVVRILVCVAIFVGCTAFLLSYYIKVDLVSESESTIQTK